MNRLLIIPLISLLWSSPSKAQDTGAGNWMPLENRIGLALGIGSVSYLDENSSPLVYRSRPKNVKLFYNLESKHFLFALNIGVKIGSNTPKNLPDRTMQFVEQDYRGKIERKQIPVRGSFLAGTISLGAYYKIPSTQNSTFRVALGGRFSNELSYPQGWSSSGIFNATGFSPEGMVQHVIDNHHSFNATIGLPVVTRLTRLPYDNTVSQPNQTLWSGFFRNSHWVGPSSYLAPRLVLGYQYNMNQKWGAGLQYELNSYHINSPGTMTALSQTLLANFYHQF